MRISFLAAVVIAVLAPAVRADDVKTVLMKMQGDWTVVSIEENGKPEPPAEVAKFAVTVKDDKFIVTGDEKTRTMTIKIDPAKTPPTIDLNPDDPSMKRKVVGIYELIDNTLKIAGQDNDDKRPTDFSSAKGVTLLVLKKKG